MPQTEGMYFSKKLITTHFMYETSKTNSAQDLVHDNWSQNKNSYIVNFVVAVSFKINKTNEVWHLISHLLTLYL